MLSEAVLFTAVRDQGFTRKNTWALLGIFRSSNPFAMHLRAHIGSGDALEKLQGLATQFNQQQPTNMKTTTLRKGLVTCAVLLAAVSMQAAVVTITSTITIAAGATYNGNGNTIKAVGMGDGSQNEGQKPFFRLNGNSRLQNVKLSAPGVDGCHFYGTGWMTSVTWQDVGEDAWTLKSSGTGHVDNSSMVKAADKAGQVNAAGQIDIYQTNTDDTGKVIRQNGGSTFTCNFFYYPGTHNHCHEAIGRTDSSTTRFRYRSISVPNFTGPNGWWYGRNSQASTF